MQLVRFAYVDPHDALKGSTTIHVGDVEIITWGNSEEGSRLVSASVPLTEMPPTDDGRVSLPEAARRRAERALELTSGLLTISRGSACGLSSPSLVVALRAESDDDRVWLGKQCELVGFTRAIAEPDFAPGVDMELAARLGDRADGVALLSEAVSNRRMLGRFGEAIRVFERGFARSSDKLVVVLAEFLEQRPALGYTKTEVKNWISRIRGRVVHADSLGREPALEADVRPFVGRMVLAAYEVVLNKTEWGSPSTTRRELWTPRAGPLDPFGRSAFIEQHALDPPIEGRIWDRFGAYPLHLGAPGLNVPEEYWPSTGPDTTRTEPFGLQVVPRSRLVALQPAKSNGAQAPMP